MRYGNERRLGDRLKTKEKGERSVKQGNRRNSKKKKEDKEKGMAKGGRRGETLKIVSVIRHRLPQTSYFPSVSLPLSLPWFLLPSPAPSPRPSRLLRK